MDLINVRDMGLLIRLIHSVEPFKFYRDLIFRFERFYTTDTFSDGLTQKSYKTE